jgi:hypothetical protein
VVVGFCFCRDVCQMDGRRRVSALGVRPPGQTTWAGYRGDLKEINGHGSTNPVFWCLRWSLLHFPATIVGVGRRSP